MKKLVIVFGFLSTTILALAQTPNKGFLLSGEVIYQDLMKMDIQLEGVDEQLAAEIPKERKSEKILHFTEEAALFENHQKEDAEETMHMEGSGMMIKMYEPDNKIYIDLINNKVIEQQEFMSRVFLIESELEQEKWKLTGKQLNILDYTCQEAIAELEGNEVHAWFTPEIGVSVGPGRYRGLPGLVLAVEMNDGDRRLEATGIDLKPLEKKVLKKPAKGKKVTHEEFENIVAEKMKEMGMEGDGTWHGSGGSGQTSTVVISIQQ